MSKKSKKKKQEKMGRLQKVFHPKYNVNKSDDHWESGLEIIKECPDLEKEAVIILDPTVHDIINAMLQEFDTTEFLVYLNGEVNEENGKLTVFLNDVVVPKQEVAAVTVDVLESIPSLAVLHKHPGGSSFSNVDDDFVNSNHLASIACDKNNMTAVCRIKTSCGRYVLVDADIEIGIRPDTKQFIDAAKKQITEKQIVYDNWRNYGGYGVYGNKINQVNQSCDKQKISVTCTKVNGVPFLDIEAFGIKCTVNLTESEWSIRNDIEALLTDDTPYYWNRTDKVDKIMDRVRSFKKIYGITS